MIPAFLFSEGSEVRRTRMVSAAHLAPFHFYRLVEKTERAYERLAGHLVSARRSGRIDWGAIRDGGTTRGTVSI
jgi:hypothetical protein